MEFYFLVPSYYRLFSGSNHFIMFNWLFMHYFFLFFLSSFSTYTLQEKAFDESQKYKEGNFILEKARMLKEGW